MHEPDFDRSCFVIMPFGKEMIEDRQVDFDAVFDHVFARAIRNVKLEQGGKLRPWRADKDPTVALPHAAIALRARISRLALADMTGDNLNVSLELGLRWGANRSGTVLVRMECWNRPVPFNIGVAQILPYADRPEKKIRQSRKTIAAALRSRLQSTVSDNPYAAAAAQILTEATPTKTKSGKAKRSSLWREIERAEQALRRRNIPRAIDHYRLAIEQMPENPYLQQISGLLLRRNGQHKEAVRHFRKAAATSKTYPDAFRELGLAQREIRLRNPLATGMPTGEAALKRALALDPADRQTTGTLSGILKEGGRLREARDVYRIFDEHAPGDNTFAKPRLQIERLMRERKPFINLCLQPDSRHKFSFNVSNLPGTVMKSDVRKLLSGYGRVSHVSEQKSSGGKKRGMFGMLEVPSDKSLYRMCDDLDSSERFGGLMGVEMGSR